MEVTLNFILMSVKHMYGSIYFFNNVIPYRNLHPTETNESSVCVCVYIRVCVYMYVYYIYFNI